MIRQNRNKIMTIFKIMSSLLNCCNKKQTFLIMRFVSDFIKNYFSWIESNRMSLLLTYVDHERYKLKQNRYNDKLWYIDFSFDEVFKNKMNQHKRFRKHFDESLKRLSCSFLKNEWLILFFPFTFFK